MLMFLFLITLKTEAEIVWEPLKGPFGGNIASVFEDQNGDLYAQTTKSLYSSSNYGELWEKVNTDNLVPQHIIFGNNQEMYLTTYPHNNTNNKLYKRVNSNDNWFEVVVDQKIGNINSIMFLNNSRLIVCSDSGAYESNDDGETWDLKYKINVKNAFIQQLCFINDNTIYAMCYRGLFKTTNNGEQWSLVENGIDKQFTVVRDIVVYDDLGLYFVFTQSGVYRSNDAGKKWKKLGNGCPQTQGLSLLRTKNQGLVISSSGGIFQSFDNGDNWDTISTSGGSNIFGTKDESFYCSTSRGVQFSTNLKDWTPKNNGICDTYINQILVYKTNNAPNYWDNNILASFYNYLYLSTDYGSTWTKCLEIPNGSVKNIIINKEGLIFVSTSGNGVYVSTDYGDTWSQSNTGLGELDCRALISDNNNILYLATASYIYKSLNNGQNWSICAQQAQPIQANSLAITSDNTIFAGTWSYGAMKSTDGGTIWKQIKNPKNTVPQYLAINSKDEIFVIDTDKDLYSSSNKGDTWSLASSKTEATNLFFYKNCILAGSTNSLTNSGLIKSEDGGKTWHSEMNGIDGLMVTDIEKSSQGYIVLATDKGIYISQDIIVDVNENLKTGPELIIAPNPAQSFINIKSQSLIGENVEVVIMNSLGQVIMKTEVPNLSYEFKLDISSLNQGAYLCTVKSVLISETQKFIVSK